MSKGNTVLLRLSKSQAMAFVFLLSCREHILSVSHSGIGRKLIKWTVLKETILNDILDKRSMDCKIKIIRVQIYSVHTLSKCGILFQIGMKVSHQENKNIRHSDFIIIMIKIIWSSPCILSFAYFSHLKNIFDLKYYVTYFPISWHLTSIYFT